MRTAPVVRNNSRCGYVSVRHLQTRSDSGQERASSFGTAALANLYLARSTCAKTADELRLMQEQLRSKALMAIKKSPVSRLATAHWS
jgi:hypothetical protein